MGLNNWYGLPQAVVRAVENDTYDRGECDYTVTELISPPRQKRLRDVHADDIEEDVSERIWALLGQSVHSILERADAGMKEERLYMDIEGVRVGGRYDTISLALETMSDYKLTSVWSVIDGPKPEWVAQLNYLRLLAFSAGYKIEKLKVVAFLRDWIKARAKHEKDYPRVGVAVLDIPVWEISDTIAHMQESIIRHQEARSKLPLCTPQERWERPTVYAAKKTGRKSALPNGLHSTMADAIAHASGVKGGFVETRKGTSVRCEDYCNVAPFCKQHLRGES